MIDITERYKDMIDSFNADYIYAINSKYGISCMVQSLKRIKFKRNLTNQDIRLLKDLDSLNELNFNLRHGFVKIVKVENNGK